MNTSKNPKQNFRKKNLTIYKNNSSLPSGILGIQGWFKFQKSM